MEWIDYREKLGVGLFDEEKGSFCSSLILNRLDDYYKSRINDSDFFVAFDFDAVSQEEYKNYCAATGTQYGDILETCKDKVRDVLENHKTPFRTFLAYFMAFINCLNNRENGVKQEEMLALLQECFQQSRLQYALLIDNGEYFIFPKGAKELDDTLVSQPLEWLSGYPVSYKAFSKALKAYAAMSEDSASDIADFFRKALETFFQEFFETDRALENCKTSYGKFLKNHGIPKEIANNFETVLQMYTEYMNAYAKHHDKAGENALEYIMYQTGNIVRLLITLSKEDK